MNSKEQMRLISVFHALNSGEVWADEQCRIVSEITWIYT